MKLHNQITDRDLWHEIRRKKITLAGNKQLKIYGTLGCKSGKKMKRENRVFFTGREEALEFKYRPCGHCMKHYYKIWKDGSV